MSAESTTTGTAAGPRAEATPRAGGGRISAARMAMALAVIRVVLGIVFTAHGAQKIFQFGIGGVVGSFEQQGIPLAPFTGAAVSFIEFFGGLALIAGFMTRVAAVGVGLVMLGAIVYVHLPAFFAPAGIEFPLTLLAIAVALVLAGPGALSVDAARARRRG